MDNEHALLVRIAEARERNAAAAELANLIAVLACPNLDLVGDRTTEVATLAVAKALAPFRAELKEEK